MKLSDRLAQPIKVTTAPLVLPDKLAKKIQRIRRRWPDLPSLPPEHDRETILRGFLQRIEEDDWQGATVAEVARCLRIAFQQEFRENPEFDRLRTFLLTELYWTSLESLVSAAWSTYLETWLPGADHTNALAECIAKARNRGLRPPRWEKLLANIPMLLDPEAAHLAVAAEMGGMDDPWTGLKRLGVVNPHGPGLWANAHLAWLKRIAGSLETADGVKRLLAWLHPQGASGPMTGDRAARAIEALLSPWLRREPPEDIRELLTSRLTGIYNDPRLSRGGAWGAVDRELLERFMRWLVGAQMRMFLDVITQVEGSHMWAPRREFWLGMYEKGRISEAWAAFSKEGVTVARRLAATHGSRGLAFGRQVVGGHRKNTSLLIMRIGNAIVVEGSHSYKVHVFDAKHPKAPRLYEPSYDCESIRRLPKVAAIVHHAESWKWNVEREIAKCGS